MPKHECQNCSKTWSDDEIKPIKDLHERVAPGEPMPSGECPECGALTHQINYYRQPVLETRVYLMSYTMAAISVGEAKTMAAMGQTIEEATVECRKVMHREPRGNPVLIDPPEEKHVALIPGLTTPEGQAKLKQLLERREYLDYQCYMELQRLQTNGDLVKLDDHEKETVDRLLKDRAAANHEFIEVTVGRKD